MGVVIKLVPNWDGSSSHGFSHIEKRKRPNYVLNNSFVGMVIYILVNIETTERIKCFGVV
jgi:hypothetical protein